MTRRRFLPYVCVFKFLKLPLSPHRNGIQQESNIYPAEYVQITLIRFDNTASYRAKNRLSRTLYQNCYRLLLSSIRLIHFNNDNRFRFPWSTVATDARNGYYLALLRSLLFCFCFSLLGPQTNII